MKKYLLKIIPFDAKFKVVRKTFSILDWFTMCFVAYFKDLNFLIIFFQISICYFKLRTTPNLLMLEQGYHFLDEKFVNKDRVIPLNIM